MLRSSNPSRGLANICTKAALGLSINDSPRLCDGLHGQRNPDIRHDNEWTVEFEVRNTDYRECDPVHDYRATDDSGVTVEEAAPRCMTQDHDRRAARVSGLLAGRNAPLPGLRPSYSANWPKPAAHEEMSRSGREGSSELPPFPPAPLFSRGAACTGTRRTIRNTRSRNSLGSHSPHSRVPCRH